MASQPTDSHRLLPGVATVLIVVSLLLMSVPAAAQEPDDIETLARLTHTIEETDLSGGIRTSFLVKVAAAARYVTDGSREDAVDVLKALRHQVDALAGIQLAEADVRRLVADLDIFIFPSINPDGL